MVLFLTIVLLFSCIGMAALLWVKHWELSTGRVVFSGARVQLSQVFHAIVYLVESVIPQTGLYLRMRASQWLRVTLRSAIARLMLSVERALERSLYFLRQGLSSREDSGNSVSAFLQEVAEHKKRLVRRAPRSRAPVS